MAYEIRRYDFSGFAAVIHAGRWRHLGLSFATDAIVQKLHSSAQLLTTWDKIDELPEGELDRLAEELHITWYLKSEPIDVKRNLVKNSDQVYQKLGTKWAVENVIHTYFGDGYIQEWFQYEGEPGHFRIFSANPSITDERLMQFWRFSKRSNGVLPIWTAFSSH